VKIRTTEQRMVVISDLHLGNPFSLAGRKLEDFLTFVREENYALCVNGDGLEILQASFLALAGDAIGPMEAVRRLAEEGRRVYYVVGNHDIALEHLLHTWLGEHISPFLNVRSGDRRIRIEHGHLYDPFFVRSPRTYELMTRFAGPLLHIYPDVYYLWSWYRRVKDGLTARMSSQKGALPSVYQEAASMLLHRGFDTVIFGHTHNAEVVEVPGGTYVNSGNWLRSSHYVEINEGLVTLRRWEDDAVLGVGGSGLLGGA
jgi:UDP-2,3-diacylglucosamine pyrophosphatase LpxH